MSSPSIMFIAGDISGDHHASPVISRIRQTYPDAHIWGIGGPVMQKAGFSPNMPFEPFNKMGFVEVIRHLGFFLDAKKSLISEMARVRPDCLICVDYPGFNMHMMKAAFQLEIPVVWYIAPTVWAWKKKRAKILAQFASHIACIFPFEVQYFSQFTKNVSFVGNPLIEAIQEENIARSGEPFKGAGQLLALVPGSRFQEIENMLQRMIGAYKLLKKQNPSLRAKVSRCENLPLSLYEKAVSGTDVEIVTGSLRSLFAESDLALVTSGTATLEAALFAVPMVVVYKTSFITYTIVKNLLTIPFIGLPNIIANRFVVPECIQGEATEQAMAEKLSLYLNNRELYENTKKELAALRDKLGLVKPSEKVFEIIDSLLKN